LHIPYVVNIPSEKLQDVLTDFRKNDTIICVCNHGKERSKQAAELIYNAGFENTFYLEGGTSGWFN
jgi:rhodanese-related sulfurtransferase